MTLYELRDRVLTLPALEKRMESLTQDIKESEDEVSNLLRQYERESRDVERMQKDSFSAFLFRLVGKYEDKLEKEQLEEINAKIALDRAAARVDSIIHETDELASRISVLRADERTYQRELENRRRELNLSEPDGIRYAELENERNVIISQITEIEEALKAANRAMSTAEMVADSLDSAKSWATFDAFSRGGIISHMAKYSHIDDAESNFSVLSNNLRDLKSELSDVQGLTVPGFNEISSSQRTIDFWFDNIFTDLSVRNQIAENAEQISYLIQNLNKTESTLEAKLREKENELTRNSEREEELLLSIKK